MPGKLDFRAQRRLRTALRPAMTPEGEARPNWSWHDEAGAGHPGGPAVVFDIDGVLSDAAGRQHLLDPALTVVLLTGRPLGVQPQTLAWLRRYGLRWDLLVMRDRGDYAQVTTFKQNVVGDLRAHGFDLRLAFEDDPSNHAMYVAAGIPCVYIHSGYYA